MFSYSKTAMERVMNVQDVIFGGRWRKITWVAGSRKNGGATGCGRLTKTGLSASFRKETMHYEKGTFLMS